jgi:hypothetical protein
MSNARVTCKTCGRPLPPKSGKGRNRVYCGDACRNVAYLERRGESRQPENVVAPATLAEDYAYEVDHVERIRPRERAEIDRWVEMGQRFDVIIDSPVMLARFMDELLCRIAAHALLEDYRNQRAINQLVVIYFMVGRITEGDFTLPAVSGA